MSEIFPCGRESRAFPTSNSRDMQLLDDKEEDACMGSCLWSRRHDVEKPPEDLRSAHAMRVMVGGGGGSYGFERLAFSNCT